ncbi:hypothetical protein, partial [Achromobacter ruhlandii]|uniref:hypothetical protein n=1 Tax=Achromobacter ruhlandii TaxID=72557 RepID=UPI003B9FDA34
FVCDGLVQVQAVVVGLENFFLHVDCSLEMKFALQMRERWEAAKPPPRDRWTYRFGPHCKPEARCPCWS